MSCQSGERLTSRLIIVSELNSSGQPTQKRGARVGYLRRRVLDLCNKTQNTTVIRTSAATVMTLVREGIDLPETVVPVNTFMVIEPGWTGHCQAKDQNPERKLYPVNTALCKRREGYPVTLGEFVTNEDIKTPTLVWRILL